MGKSTTIESFFKQKSVENSESSGRDSGPSNHTVLSCSNSESTNPSVSRKSRRVETFDINSLERDPGIRPQIWDYAIENRDEVRRAYIKALSHQPIQPNYPKSNEKHPRSFQSSWYKFFPSWLEYSPIKDAAFCLRCFLFRQPDGPSGIDAFTVNGFRKWKKVRDGKNCAFLAHVGKDMDSFHCNAERSCDDLMNQSIHIAQRLQKYTSQQIIDNRLRLKVSVDVAKWLTFQGCAFRGHDETKDSLNGGNFIELSNIIASYNDKVGEVMANAPKNATYTSPRVQKEILHVFSTKVKNTIRDEIGEAKFCLIVDEARDESKREQMSIGIRFVDGDGATSTQRGDADAAYEALTSFDFVLILHITKQILEISDLLCQALQHKTQDILNAMQLVSSTKLLIQKLRDNGWDELLSKVKSFCESVNIPIPDLSAQYVGRKGRARHQQVYFTFEQHYKVNIFLAAIDTQLQELNHRFNEKTMEMFVLSSALDPREMILSYRIDDIHKLVQIFYPNDFTEYEIAQLKIQLQHFDQVRQHQDFRTLSTISDLCRWLVQTRKSTIYTLVYRVITLILTLPVYTATTERSFSAMSFVKNRLRNKMEDGYLSDCLILYIEKEIARTINVDSIIDDFRDLKERRSLF